MFSIRSKRDLRIYLSLLTLFALVHQISPSTSNKINTDEQSTLVQKLTEIFLNDNDVADLLVFLDTEGDEGVCQDSLRDLLNNNDVAFEKMANRCLQHGRKYYQKNDDQTRKEEWLDKNFDELSPIDLGGNHYLETYVKMKMPVCNLAQGLQSLSPERKQSIESSIMHTVQSIFGKGSKITEKVSDTLMLAQSTKPEEFGVIITIQLSYETIQSIKSWMNGEISGKRCTKQIIDSSASIFGGYAGASVGATIGSMIAPGCGTVAGAVLGGAAGSFTASTFSEWLTEYLFNLPKQVAVENAYRYLGLSSSCSDVELKKQYRTLALLYHPDKKGGSSEDFHKLQISTAIIKQARGMTI